MVVGPDSELFETVPVGFGAFLTAEVGDDHRVDEKPALDERVPQPQHILVVRDPEVPAHLVLLDVDRADDDHDLRLVPELEQHVQLAVRTESRQDARSVVVVEELASELQVELVSEARYALLDVFRLNLEIFLVIEPVKHGDGITFTGNKSITNFPFFRILAVCNRFFFFRTG